MKKEKGWMCCYEPNHKGWPPLVILENRKMRVDIYRLPATAGRNGEEVEVYLFDESISRVHCRFDINMGEVTLTDLNSTMGTKIEKMQLEPGRPYPLKDGSRIRIGKLKYKIVIDYQAVMEFQQKYLDYDEKNWNCNELDPAVEKDDRGNESVHGSEITELMHKSKGATSCGEPTELLIYSDQTKLFCFPSKKLVNVRTGEVACMIEKTPFFIGRRPEDNDACLDVKGVSKQHLFIEKCGDGFFITDLDSTNGVLVNGEKIPASEPVQLKAGDIIKIGEERYCFEEKQQ